jgi:hypothetical protein
LKVQALTFLALALLGPATQAQASTDTAVAVSMLQEHREIACRLPTKISFSRPTLKDSIEADGFAMDAKETKMRLLAGDKTVAELERIKFLDSAVSMVAKDDPKLVVLFQILPNGTTTLLHANRYLMREADCADTGASKTCKNDGVKRLFWSPERLELEADGSRFSGSIDQYGFFAYHATYFRAVNAKNTPSSKAGQAAITLIDFGSPFEVFEGRLWSVQCRYL